MSYPPSGGYGYPPGGGYPPQQPYGQSPCGAPPQHQPFGGPPQQQSLYGGGSLQQSPYGNTATPYGATQQSSIGFDGLNNQPAQIIGMPTVPGQGQNYAQALYPSEGPPPALYNQHQSQSFGGLAYAATAAVGFQNQSGLPNPGGSFNQPPIAYSGCVPQQSYAPQPASTHNTPYASTSQNQISHMTNTTPNKMIPKEPVTQGTVKEFSGFNGQSDAEALRKAMKGFGTDEKAITHIMGTRSNAQRQRIKIEFATLYGKDLIKELKSELSGNYEALVLGLLMPSAEYDAYHLFSAMKGLGTDEKALIEILCTRSNAQIKAASDAFRRLYKKDLEKELKDETSGHFRRLLVSLVQAARLENDPLDHNKAAVDAKALYSAGEARWGTDESRFNVILATRSFAQLRLTFDEYSKISKRTMEKAIQSEMSGDLKDGMLAIVKCARNRPAYFAERLYYSMKGLGTDDATLIRVMVSRSEIDMVQIKQEFQTKYGKTLARFITEDCSGDYKKLLVQLCGGS